MSEPRQPDHIVKRIEGAEILQFPRLTSTADATPPQVPPSEEDSGGGGDAPPPGGPSDSGGGDGDSADGIVDTINKTYALVQVGQRALIIREQPQAPAEDRIKMMTWEAFKTMFENKGSVVTRKQRQEDGTWSEVKRYVKWAPLWIRAKNRRTYDGVEFHPSPVGEAGMPGYFNLWRGFSVSPDAAPASERQKKYKTFRDHLLTNICSGSEEHFYWLFAWFAKIVQRPRERIGTAIVIRGGMGVGKSKLGEIFGALFAAHYFLVDDPRYVSGQFNLHMATCLLLQVDEGFWAGDKAAEGRLKGLITSSKQMIEAKGVDPIPLKNYVHLLFTSNEDWVVPAGMDERRFAVFDVAPHAAQNLTYFGEMDEEMRNGGYEALLADLLVVDLDAPDAPKIRVIPKTGALLEQKLRSLDPITAWWYARLVDGAPTHRRSAWPTDVPRSVLFDDYVKSAERIGVRRKADETALGMRLRKLIPGLRSKRAWTHVEMPDGSMAHRRVWCFDLPTLLECRAAFEAALGGQAVDWGSAEDNDNAVPDPAMEGDF